MRPLSEDLRQRIIATLIAARGSTVRYLPPYGPVLNPFEMAFAKLKSHLRHAAACMLEALKVALVAALASFRPARCRGFFRHARYASIYIENELNTPNL